MNDDHSHHPINARVRELLEQIAALQDELRTTLAEQEAKVRYTIEGKRIEFEQSVREAHRRLRTGLWQWLRSSERRHILAAPFIYGMIVPLLALDLSLGLYQQVCFRLFRIAPVRRRDYWVIDRHKLAYLNLPEKFNCLYCEYANGLMAFAREVVARTEQYWCPIKHAHKVLDPHDHYPHFVDYGDAEGLQQQWATLRRELAPPRACEPGGCQDCHGKQP